VQAQAQVMEQVRQELIAGRKRSHWMWFVFPQLASLGNSSMARRFAITGLEEAEAYLQHPILGSRLIECSELVQAVQGSSIQQIFGDPDQLKFRSCMTLFNAVPGAAPVFRAALEKYFAGAPDALTAAKLAGAQAQARP
jgi:uncharacterized protein (DUF1810 family)